ncbi:MAG: hypothetical protein ACI8UD_004333, partial [Planctomycetota bacterium]
TPVLDFHAAIGALAAAGQGGEEGERRGGRSREELLDHLMVPVYAGVNADAKDMTARLLMHSTVHVKVP